MRDCLTSTAKRLRQLSYGGCRRCRLNSPCLNGGNGQTRCFGWSLKRLWLGGLLLSCGALYRRRRGGRLLRRRSEEHTSELQSRENLVCRLLLEKKKITK